MNSRTVEINIGSSKGLVETEASATLVFAHHCQSHRSIQLPSNDKKLACAWSSNISISKPVRSLLETSHHSPSEPYHAHLQTTMSLAPARTYFRVTLIRSGIGLPKQTRGVLAALGLHKRMATVFHPVTPDIAGQIFAVKELVAVSEVDKPLSKTEMKERRRPDPGFWVESTVPR